MFLNTSSEWERVLREHAEHVRCMNEAMQQAGEIEYECRCNQEDCVCEVSSSEEQDDDDDDDDEEKEEEGGREEKDKENESKESNTSSQQSKTMTDGPVRIRTRLRLPKKFRELLKRNLDLPLPHVQNLPIPEPDDDDETEQTTSPPSVDKYDVDPRLDALIERIYEPKYTVITPGSFDKEMTELVPSLRILPSNDSIISLQTIIRDRNSPREDFVFNTDRLIRLVIEAGLNLLPFNNKTVITPTNGVYNGVEYLKSNCGVSIVRSGEAMEKALRDCCRVIRIGKVLIQSDEETHEARVLYAKLPPDISLRKVLLLYPIMSTGNTVVKAVKVLKKNGVKESNIILINLFTTPVAVRAVASRFKEMIIQTTEVHPVGPSHFGQKYFGTD